MDAALARHLKSKKKTDERNNKQHKFAVAQDSKEAKDFVKNRFIKKAGLININPALNLK